MSSLEEAERRLDWFVDRDVARRRIDELVRERGSVTLVDLQGIQGSGKSLLLRLLRRTYAEDPRVAFALVEMGVYELPTPTSPIEVNEAAPATEEDQYRKRSQFLVALADQLGTPVPSAFAPFADAAASQSLKVEVHG